MVSQKLVKLMKVLHHPIHLYLYVEIHFLLISASYLRIFCITYLAKLKSWYVLLLVYVNRQVQQMLDLWKVNLDKDPILL